MKAGSRKKDIRKDYFDIRQRKLDLEQSILDQMMTIVRVCGKSPFEDFKDTIKVETGQTSCCLQINKVGEVINVTFISKPYYTSGIGDDNIVATLRSDTSNEDEEDVDHD